MSPGVRTHLGFRVDGGAVGRGDQVEELQNPLDLDLVNGAAARVVIGGIGRRTTCASPLLSQLLV